MTPLFKDLKVAAAQLLKEKGIDYSKCRIEDMATPLYHAVQTTHNQHDIDLYCSGLLLRYWYCGGRVMSKSPGLFESYDECISMVVYRAIMYAMRYGAWLNPNKKVTADQAIKQCVETSRRQVHYSSNLIKNKANYNTMALDDRQGDETSPTWEDALVDEVNVDPAERVDTDAARSIIQTFINRNKYVEAIILDVIAFNDVERVVKVKHEDTKQEYREFWPYKCVQALRALPEDYDKYFLSNYNVKEPQLNAVLTVMRSAPNNKLYRYLRKTLAVAKSSLTTDK